MTLENIPVYLEIGQRKTFAGALDWPGWARGGRDEAAALAALLVYGPRYARVLQFGGLNFQPPDSVEALRVVERLPGSGTTDFGVPDVAPSSDLGRINEAEVRRSGEILQACWAALDAAIAATAGVELKRGPRGGGRQLEAIARHVLEGEQGYLRRLAWKMPKHEAVNLNEEMRLTRQAIMDALSAAAQGDLPERGPRGGPIWSARYFVRRVAWHALDHLWEIEDRSGLIHSHTSG